ncbi:MAG: DEAD/DEAH box helicase [Microgenomates group bacterium]
MYRGFSNRGRSRGGSSGFGGRSRGFGGGRSRGGGGGGGGRGGFRAIRTFDPTRFINTPQVVSQFAQTEYVVKNAFTDFNVSDQLKKNIVDRGYTTPTPIQDQSIPAIIEGRDLIGIANTGTGKTAAFLIPLIDKVLKDRNHRVLIIAPTRELAAQIKEEFLAFSKGLGIYCTLCIGGANMRRQQGELMRNPNFVVGTPGRIQDHIRTRNLNLSHFGSIVLDEADHMVDIGFINDIKYIVSLLQKERQSLFFSATIDGKVRDILQNFVQNPVTVSVKKGETAENVEQKVIRVTDPSKKIEMLNELLNKEEFDKVLVFGRTKHGVQRLAEELTKRGFRSDAIHGNKRQNQRQKTLDNFKRNNIQILIATDVAARGLDIPNVSHVINYDLPESLENYTHRIGRTGRADKKGIAITFVS